MKMSDTPRRYRELDKWEDRIDGVDVAERYTENVTLEEHNNDPQPAEGFNEFLSMLAYFEDLETEIPDTVLEDAIGTITRHGYKKIERKDLY